jgi:hypothetical protein
MKTIAKLIAAAIALTVLAGCIVVPAGPGYHGQRHGHGHHHRY